MSVRPQLQEDQQSERGACAWERHHLNGRGWWFKDEIAKKKKKKQTGMENVRRNAEKIQVSEAQALVETTKLHSNP